MAIPGIDVTEHPWRLRDTLAFGGRPAGVDPSLGERIAGAARGLRSSQAARAAIPDPAQPPARGAVRRAGQMTSRGVSALNTAGGRAVGALGRLGITGAAATGAAYGIKDAVTTPTEDYRLRYGLPEDPSQGNLRRFIGDVGVRARGMADDVVIGAVDGVGDLINMALPASMQIESARSLQPDVQARGAADTPAPAPRPNLRDSSSWPAPGAPVEPPARPGTLRAMDGQSGPAVPGGNVLVTRGAGGVPEFSGMDIRGTPQYMGAENAGLRGAFTGQPSARSMAAADALADRQQVDSQARVASQGLRGAMDVPMATAPVVRHSGNDWQARNDLRNLEVSAGSITNRPEWRSGAVVNDRGMLRSNPQADPDGKVAAYQAALKSDVALRGAQPAMDLETIKSNNGLRGEFERAAAARYGADQGLRGDVFKAQGAAATARAQSLRDALNWEREERNFATERRDKMTKRLDEVFSSYATGDDGKVNAGQLATLRNNAQAFVGSAVAAARKRGDNATASALEKQGVAALADDPAMMQRYAAAMKADAAARGGWGGSYVATDNPGARTIDSVTSRNLLGMGGEVVLSDGTRVPRNRIEYDPRSGILPNALAHIDPWSNRTTEYDTLDPRAALRRGAQ